MTFLEKAKLESEEKRIKFSEDGLPSGCPYKYGYEEDYSCGDVECVECWNREMPNTELENVKKAFSEIGKAISKASEDVYKEDMNTSYNKGFNDACEFARLVLCKKTMGENKEIFGYETLSMILSNLTPQEALAKLKAYEEAQIEVGDVLEYKDEKVLSIVLKVYGKEHLYLLFADGSAGVHPKEGYKKTGKHIDIQSILDQIAE